MSKKSKNNKLQLVVIIILAVTVALVVAPHIMFGNKKSTFKDGLGQKQTIDSYQECLDWVMPTKVIDGVTYCYAPGDVTFSSNE